MKKGRLVLLVVETLDAGHRLLLDPRTVQDGEESEAAAAVREALSL